MADRGTDPRPRRGRRPKRSGTSSRQHGIVPGSRKRMHLKLDLSVGQGLYSNRLVPDVPERGRPPLPAADGGGRGRARRSGVEARRYGRQGADDQLQPASCRSSRSPKRYQTQGITLRRSRPGGCPRPDPCSREVRLAQRLQVLDVCNVVDPPGGSKARLRREQGPHHPDPGTCRRARAEGCARAASCWQSSSVNRRLRRSPGPRSTADRTCARGAGGRPRGRLDRHARG